MVLTSEGRDCSEHIFVGCVTVKHQYWKVKARCFIGIHAGKKKAAPSTGTPDAKKVKLAKVRKCFF